ncbi:uncharacterized protein LOC122535837 [Frieseomelitta varia]|uniref:uncharacterized protein LOC122535837 n=1 Tax=Frieseomelitta varia TaxID=561572 RepID=UPI001CB67C9C|nr:uncharacterized protein LOC122535837 [Frieseomelitta varia]
MFMFPEPPPADHYITDVSPTFLSDGIFYHGEPASCHKCVAKQLRPIKRTVSDPLAPMKELDSNTLNRWLEKEKEMYVDCPTKDDGVVFQTLSNMPKWKSEYQQKQKSVFSMFPRSRQYELWHVRERRLKDLEKQKAPVVPRVEKEERLETDDEPCGLLKPPFWWRDKSRKPSELPVGNINDYVYEKLKFNHEEKLDIDHSSNYIPDVIRRTQNPEDTSIKDALDHANTFEVVQKRNETLPVESLVDANVCHSRKRTPAMDCCKLEDVEADDDRRWQPLHEYFEFPKTKSEREHMLRELTRPFLHDMHTWYTKNKPTKLIIPLKHSGKRPMPEWRFSHL